jgi:ubiquinone/menaquinone biosynthesis C-methylase UbiE
LKSAHLRLQARERWRRIRTTAFEKGGGVRFADVGEDGVTAFDLINRGQYEQRFTSYWLPTMPRVTAGLEEGGRVLDVGCGAGRVCMAIAKEFPKTDVTGLDPDEESIKQARDAVAAAGLANRIRFLAGTADDLDATDSFDLITACDCIHDFASPHATLKKLHRLLKPEGVLFVIEPKVADRLEDNVNPIATMFYGFSLFHCMTQSLAAGGPGLGTCLGPERTEKLVREAGFRRFEKLDIKSPVNLFYAAQP